MINLCRHAEGDLYINGEKHWVLPEALVSMAKEWMETNAVTKRSKKLANYLQTERTTRKKAMGSSSDNGKGSSKTSKGSSKTSKGSSKTSKGSSKTSKGSSKTSKGSSKTSKEN